MFHKLTHCLFIGIFTLLAVWHVSAQDDFDLMLYAISDGETIEDTLSEDILGRLYAFNGEAGDEVTITMTADDDAFDTYLVLLGEAGGVFTVNDDRDDGSLNSQIDDFELPYSGTYFVLASTFSAVSMRDDSGLDDNYTFELTVEGVDDVDEDTLIEYFYGPLSVGDSNVEGYSNRSEPIFYWLFNGEADQAVTITLQSNDFDTLLYFFDATGAMLALNDNADGTDSQIEDFTLPDDGTYLIFATDLFYKFVVDEDSTLFDGGNFEISLEEE